MVSTHPKEPPLSASLARTAHARREARRHAFLEGAGRLFCERGYGATSLGDVVKVSGGSLATLYELFGNKPGLFKALIEDRCRSGFAALDQTDVDDLTPREALTAIGTGFVDLIHAPMAIAIYRMIIAEGSQFPELPTLFYETGPATSQARVGAWFAEQDRRGTLRVPDPRRAAIDFCGLLCGDSQMRALIGLPVELTETERRARVDHVVEVMLRAYAAG